MFNSPIRSAFSASPLKAMASRALGSALPTVSTCRTFGSPNRASALEVFVFVEAGPFR